MHCATMGYERTGIHDDRRLWLFMWDDLERKGPFTGPPEEDFLEDGSLLENARKMVKEVDKAFEEGDRVRCTIPNEPEWEPANGSVGRWHYASKTFTVDHDEGSPEWATTR